MMMMMYYILSCLRETPYLVILQGRIELAQSASVVLTTQLKKGQAGRVTRYKNGERGTYFTFCVKRKVSPKAFGLSVSNMDISPTIM